MLRWGKSRVLVSLTLALAVLLAAVSMTPAQAASAPLLSVSPGVPFKAEAFSIATAFPSRVRRPVRLQRLVGRRWVNVAHGRTSPVGVARFSYRTTATRVQLRILAPRFRAKGRGYAAAASRSRVVTTAAQSVGLALARDSAGRVDAQVIASQARPGRRIFLLAQAPGGPWRTVVSRPMGASRVTSLPDVLTSRQAKGLRLRAYLSPVGGAPAVNSAVHLPPTVTLKRTATDDSVLIGATVTGTVQRVQFFVDGQLLAEDTRAPFEATWAPRPGTHDLMARAFGPVESVLTPTQQVRTPESTVGADTGLARGYSLETVQSGFDLPTSAAVATPALVLVTEKAGLVRAVVPEDDTGWAPPRTVLDLRDQVIDAEDSGLIGIAVDPGFADNGYVYLSYVLDDGAPDDQPGQAQQVARFTWDGTRLDPSTRHVVLGAVTGTACHATENLRTPGCVPLYGRAHTIGDLAFDEQGRLLVGVGDGSLYRTPNGLADRYEARRAQDPEILSGKILRVDPTTGRGVRDNPLYTGDGSSNASRVIALGLRNPFRFTVRGDHLILGDVGDDAFEELDVVPLTSSASTVPNYGWPCLEGEAETNLPGLEQPESPWHACTPVRAAGGSEAPAYTYPHSGGGSVTAGAFLDSEAYPVTDRGRYLFGDYAQNFMRTADVSQDGEVSAVASLADATAADGPVKFLTGPDGLVWQISIFSGSLRRLRYTGEGWVDRCPAGTFRRSFHDLDGPGNVFDQEYPDNEWRWLYPYIAAQIPDQELAVPTCVAGIYLAPTAGSPWADETHPDTRAHPGDRFGTAWRGRLDLEAGTYRFEVHGSEWVRLWVDDTLVHDFYSNGFWPLDMRQHQIVLPLGQHTVRAELVHGDESTAAADVTWERIGGPPEISVVGPENGTRTEQGRVPWRVVVSDPDGESQADLVPRVRLDVDFLHYADGHYHAHPISRVTGQLTGSTTVDGAHAPGAGVVRLRATATDTTGARTTSAPVYVCLPDSYVGPCSR